MRKYLPIFVSMVALIVAFLIYLRFQPKFNFSIADKPAAEDSGAGGGTGGGAFVKPGANAWSTRYDRTGRLVSQFKVDFYDNQPDGSVKVTRPVMEYFQDDGKITQITGDDGIVNYPPGADKGTLTGGPTTPPSSGTLRHVIVKLFSSAAQQARGVADWTLTMANAQFDNDTYRLFTHEYVDAGGKVIHADEVPVTLWANDYFFTGWGMVMYWNDLDKRLKSLEIEHSRDLTIYHASTLVATPASQAAPPAAQQQAHSGGASHVNPPTPPANSPSPRQRYLATCFNDVHVFQAGEQLVGGNVSKLAVDFVAKGDNGTPGETPATSPSATPTTSTSSATTDQSSGSSPSMVASAQPPIHVYWTGKMRMVPNDDSSEPLADGKEIIHLVGAPVLLHQVSNDHQQTVDTQCASATYRTADSSATLVGDAQTPLIMKQIKADGATSTVTGQSLDYSRDARIATIHGQGEAHFPDSTDPKANLIATWEKRCVVDLADNDTGQMRMKDADLFGNVVVDHPRFHMTAVDDLKLQFDPSANAPLADEPDRSGSPRLRDIVGTGDARCDVYQPDQRPRHIGGQRLEMATGIGDGGKLYAKTIICDGSVLAVQDQQTLTAEHLRIALLPAPKHMGRNDAAGNDAAHNDEMADATLDQLIASTNVHVLGKDSSKASGNKLEVDMVDQHPHVTIWGTPDQAASVADKTSTITGPLIRLSPHDQTASVEGPGTLDTIQKPADPAKKPKPLHLTWRKGAQLAGKENWVLVTGDVVADSWSPDGTGNVTDDVTHSDRILVTLADVAPTTRSDKSPATRSTDADGTDAQETDFMKNKQVRILSLLTDAPKNFSRTAQAESTLTDATGLLLQKDDLWGRRIDYATDVDGINHQVTVRGPGTMRAEQHSPPTTRRTAPDGDGPTGGNGVSKIKWDGSFVYDEKLRAATISGNVKIAHVNDGKDPQPIRLDADVVRADLEPAARTAATQPAAAGGESVLKISKVTATGAVTVWTRDKTIYCGEVDFDPNTSILICRGASQGRVTVEDNHDLTLTTLDEAWINTKTNRLIKMINVHGSNH